MNVCGAVWNQTNIDISNLCLVHSLYLKLTFFFVRKALVEILWWPEGNYCLGSQSCVSTFQGDYICLCLCVCVWQYCGSRHFSRWCLFHQMYYVRKQSLLKGKQTPWHYLWSAKAICCCYKMQAFTPKGRSLLLTVCDHWIFHQFQAFKKDLPVFTIDAPPSSVCFSEWLSISLVYLELHSLLFSADVPLHNSWSYWLLQIISVFLINNQLQFVSEGYSFNWWFSSLREVSDRDA